MFIKIVVAKRFVTVLSVYAAQTDLDDSAKDLFYENIQLTLTKISAFEIILVCGDFSLYIEKYAGGYEGVYCGRGFGTCKLEGERTLEFVVAHNLVASNSVFTKRKIHLLIFQPGENHLVIYQSGENQSQTNYILVKRRNVKSVRDVKFIPNEDFVTQHKLLLCDAGIVKSKD